MIAGWTVKNRVDLYQKNKFFIFHVLRFLLEMQISSSYPRHEYMALHELTELTWRFLAATQLPSASPKPKIWLSVTLNCISVPPHPSFKGHKTRHEKKHLGNHFFPPRLRRFYNFKKIHLSIFSELVASMALTPKPSSEQY